MPYASSIQIVNDANGTAYAFLADNGAILQAQWNAQAQRWDQGQIVPGAFGGEKLEALYLDNLWPTGGESDPGFNPGIVLAYRIGEGSSAEIYASFGQWGGNGEINWTAPMRLTDDQVDDQAFALVASPSTSGGFSLVVQKKEAGTPVHAFLNAQADGLQSKIAAGVSMQRPDSDLYVNQFNLQFSATNPTEVELTSSSSSQASAIVSAATEPPTAKPAAAFAGNTQLSRSDLLSPSGVLGNSQATTGSTTTSTAPGKSGEGWQGPTSIQKSKGGGTLKYGVEPLQSVYRWEVNHPANSQSYRRNRNYGELPDDEIPVIDRTVDEIPETDRTVTSIFYEDREEQLDDYIEMRNRILLDNPNNISDDESSRNFFNNSFNSNGDQDTFLGIPVQRTESDYTVTAGLNLKFRGAFGIANVGSGGIASVSTAKLILGYGDEDTQGMAVKLIKNNTIGPESSKSYNVGVGGALQSNYQYSNYLFDSLNLNSLNSRESVGLDFSFRYFKVSLAAQETFRISGAVSTGYEWNQKLSASKLPKWLAVVGYADGLAGEFARKYLTGYGLGNRYKNRQKPEELPNTKLANGIAGGGEGAYILGVASAIIGTTIAATGPVLSQLAKKSPGSNYSKSSGWQFGQRLTAAVLYNGIAGIEINLANRSSLYPRITGTGADQGTWDDTFFTNAGVALPLGGMIPLLSYYHTWKGSLGKSDTAPQAAPTVGSSDTSSEPASLTSTGNYQSADTGGAYPLAYTPASASSSYFSSSPSGALGVKPTSLSLLTLSATERGAINPTQTNSASNTFPLTLFNKGANLNDGVYKKVAILGVTLDGNLDSGALASFHVVDGSIVASSFQITTAGSYLALPQSTANSGQYDLVLDLFSSRIFNLPNQNLGSADNGSVTLPLITLDSSKASSPLSSQPIQVIDFVYVPQAGASGSQPPGTIYLPYDSTTGKTTSLPSNTNSSYIYSNVAVSLYTSSSLSQQVASINAGATATVHLSNGIIQQIDLDQPLFFNPVSGTSLNQPGDYTLQLELPQAILASSGSPAPQTPPVYAVISQNLGFNNFVEDEQFTAQVGAPNSGVYLAAGLSDSLPLSSSMGGLPVQNRVVYVQVGQDEKASSGDIYYLNGTERSSSINSPGVYSYTPQAALLASELSLEQLYVNQAANDNIFFTAASSPTAVTVTGQAPANGTTASLVGDTFIAWVEASNPVVPLSTKEGGSANFQAYMEALYGAQRINYRIKEGGTSSWFAPKISDLYYPSDAIIRHLKAFNVADPENPGQQRTLLVWSETTFAAIKGEQAALASGTSIPAVIKAGWINSNPKSYQWNDLFTTDTGISTIQVISWDPTIDVGLAIEEISIGSMPQLVNGVINETPVVSWSQNVRTPYRQSVLDSSPVIYLQFGQLQSGLSDINIGSVDSASTSTTASDTGLNFDIAGALPSAATTAVQNINGTGVLNTGTGTSYKQLLHYFNNIPAETIVSGSGSAVIAVFTGSIIHTTLTVSSLTSGSLDVGDLITGPGIIAGTTISGLLSVDPTTGLGTYTLNARQQVGSTALEALPAPSNFPICAFSGAIAGTILTVTQLAQGNLSLGDEITGPGVTPGTIITAIDSFDADAGTGSFTVNNSQIVASSALVASPGTPTVPYTIEFWAQLPMASNPKGAGLVAFGQPSEGAVGAATLPTGWLLASSFVVEQITYQLAAARGLIDAIPSSISDPSTTIYGWGWAMVAEGANTTAMGGSGGNNLYNNALDIYNLVNGGKIPGVTDFLNNYLLTATDLLGSDGTNTVATIANTPITALEFSHDINPTTGLPNSSLDSIAIDTNSASLNQGFVSASAVQNNSNLQAMFQDLWNFQQKTGEAKVNFSLAPDSKGSSGVTPSEFTSESYAGYQLGFALSRGTAVSVNGNGELVFDIGNGTSLVADTITNNSSGDLRDGQWHYIVASYLPDYTSYTAAGSIVQLPTNVGTASIYVDNQLVASQANVFNAYVPVNINDQALLLANNNGGAIDQLAFYDSALTTSTITPKSNGLWPQPSAEDALAMLASLGYKIDTKTPDPGMNPGAVTSHWAARNVNPNDALLGTYYSVFNFNPETDSGTWSNASNLNPAAQLQPTSPSASEPGSLQNDLVISIPSNAWNGPNWTDNTSTTAVSYNPAHNKLTGITVVLTNVADQTKATTLQLTPQQVLLGNNTLQALQPLATATNFNYTVLTNTPSFNLVIPQAQLPGSTNAKFEDQYTATYTFNFDDQTSSTAHLVSNSQPVFVNQNGASDLIAITTDTVSAAQLTAVQTRNSAIATAAVIDQAPLQLKYIDSGEVFKSASSTAAANSPAVSSPANTFGTSQVFGSFVQSVQDGGTGNSYGWLAIAQPQSTNASSNPAGRIWIQYAGQSLNGIPTSDVANAPSTWLNALAQSNFSPDSPNLPLLGNAFNPSSSGGLLIEADPTVGWGENFGQTMLVADVNGDGVEDLVIGSPQANGGGRVYIISGQWIQNNLTNATGETILSLANPNNLLNANGQGYVTVLTPSVATGGSSTDDITVAGFGSALAFDITTKTLWAGAPNYLQQLVPTNTTAPLDSLVPIGAIYSYNYSQNSWASGEPTVLTNPILGTGGTASSLDPTGSPSTTYWGSQLGTAIAVNSSSGKIAVSAPGLYGAMLYSGTQEAQDLALGEKDPSNPYGQGALLRVQVPATAPAGSLANVSITQGTSSSNLVDIVNQPQGVDKKSGIGKEESTYMQSLKAFQTDNIADATIYYNQALQVNAVGAVFLLDNSSDLNSLSNASITATAVASQGGSTFYGPNPWNVLGASGFGSSLAFGDLQNANSPSILAIGAKETGGSGAVYLVDTLSTFKANSLGSNQYLAHLVSGLTLYGAATQDNFGNGLVDLGDTNGDGYNDLLIQAYNASSGAGNGYVLFGSDNLIDSSSTNPGVLSVANGKIGQITRADGSKSIARILSELGSGLSTYVGQGTFGPGDINGDGLNDVLLGSGVNGSAYLTWGHPYLESISNLQLAKLASDTGYMLDGLATASQGSLRSIGDFNGDGYGDFISIQRGAALTTVRLELGANTQEVLADYPYNFYSFTVDNSTQVSAAGDINGDGLSDIALFINQNLSTAGQGNLGVGSTTGILFGRTSNDLPVGSGFGYLSPVNLSAGDSTSQPLLPLPGLDISGGLSNATPAIINVGNVLYSVVKGWNNSSLWFAQSSDSGNTWSAWTDISATNTGLVSGLGASLAYFNNKLYLGFANTDSPAGLSVSSWDPTSNNPAAWSAPIQLGNGSDASSTFSTSYSPQLIDRGDALGIVWVDSNSGTLYGSYSTGPDSVDTWSAPSQLVQRVDNNGIKTYPAITATAAPSLTWLDQDAVLAVNNGGTVNVFAAIPNSLSWQLASSFSSASGEPAINTAPVLATTDTGLALTYGTSDGSITLQRLNLLDSKGYLLDGEQLWAATTLNQENGGFTSDLATVPLSVDGNLLLANVRNGAQNDQIWLNAVPNLGNPDSTTWLNTSVQLPDGSGGWTIQQQSGTVDIGTFTPLWIDDVGGLSPSAPVFAELNGVLYAAVVGYNSSTNGDDGLLFWNSSTDGGKTWSAWQQVPNYASNKAPGLAAFEGHIYLGYVATNSNLNILQLTNASVNEWSLVQQKNILTCDYVALTSENGELAAYYVGTNGDLYRTATATPTTFGNDDTTVGVWSTSTVIKYGSGKNTGNQTASGNLAVTTLATGGSDTTFIAYQGGTPSSPSKTLYLTSSSSQSDEIWALGSNLPQPSTANRGGVSLAHNSSGLILGYPDEVNGEVVYVLKQSANSGSSWSPYTSLAAPAGASLPSSGSNTSFSLLASTSSDDVLVGAINNGTGANDAIYTTIVSELPPSTSLSSSQTQSNLSAVGDLNGDGFDDLLLAANNVVVNPSSTAPTLATGVRLITGAATSSQFTASNSAGSNTQNVQLAPWRGLNNSTPVATLSGTDRLSVTTTASGSGQSLTNSADTADSTAFTATAGDLASAQNLFPAGAVITLGKPTGGFPLGDLGLIGAAGFGDLNGDGYVDYLDPASATVITGANSQTWTLWSIRAAGDVNGNGADDVLLTLAPKGPAYAPINGDVSSIISVLVDGALFNVDKASNTFGLTNLRFPLNPYNSGEIYDVTSTSTSQYAPLLQNWFEPIALFQPGNVTSITIGTPTVVNGVQPFASPVGVVDKDGNLSLVYSVFSGGIWMSYQTAPGNWQQFEIGGATGQTTSANGEQSPSAVYFGGNLYVAWVDSTKQMHISYTKANQPSGDPVDFATASWTTYAISNQSTYYSPTLIAEEGRLALYFPSDTSGTAQQDVRYMYSTNPESAAAWGSVPVTPTPGSFAPIAYSEGSGLLQFSSGTNFVSQSKISATTYQGRTVLAFSNSSGGVTIATAPSANPDPSDSWLNFSNNIGSMYAPCISTDQAFIYLSTSYSIDPSGFSSSIRSLSPAIPNDYSTYTSSGYFAGPDNLAQSQSINTAMVNGKLLAFWAVPEVAINGTLMAQPINLASLDVTVSTPVQQSLSGYSVDGNIDVNGDGFKDILISDPTDPREGLDNQYVLFGGNYLDIASQVGTPGNDNLIGTPLADVIYTLSGDDEVRSNGGADVIYTGSGNDRISIENNAFLRIDAGSGLDQIYLEGDVDQAYDLRLNVENPQYFFGTKLRDIELINSQDFGSNTISLDAAAVNASNPDRVLFLAPDSEDFIQLSSEFARSEGFDTGYGGTLWYAYAAGAAVPGTSNPALVYVNVPVGQSATAWLSTQVSIGSLSLMAAGNPTYSIASPITATGDPILSDLGIPVAAVPTPSQVASSAIIADGLTITGLKSSPGSGMFSFRISRNGSLDKDLAFSYNTTTLNSSSEPGPDYNAVAGVIRMHAGQADTYINLSVDNAAMAALKKGTVSLQVTQLQDIGQDEIHLVFQSLADSLSKSAPVLSGFQFLVNEKGDTATASFHADINDATRKLLKVKISTRKSADTLTLSNIQEVVISDFVATQVPGLNNQLNLDRDGNNNQQVSAMLEVNLHSKPGQPLVSVLGPDPLWQTTVQLVNGNQVRFQQDAPLTSWRADSGAGLVTFGLQSGSNNLTLISNAQGGSAGSLNSNNANGATSWQSTEGKAIGSRSITDGQNLKGSDWTPTASRGGVSLALLNLAVDGNQVTASFEGGVTGVFWQADGNAPSLLPVPVAVEVQRLAGYNNSLGFYSVDSITGMVAGINPGENGYLQAALARSQEEDLLLDARTLPAFGATATFNSLPLDTRERYGVLLLQNGDRSVIFSSFAAANEGGTTQMVSLSDSSNSRVLGIEDLSVAKGLGDNDFNDIIVKFQGVSLGLF